MCGGGEESLRLVPNSHLKKVDMRETAPIIPMGPMPRRQAGRQNTAQVANVREIKVNVLVNRRQSEPMSCCPRMRSISGGARLGFL